MNTALASLWSSTSTTNTNNNNNNNAPTDPPSSPRKPSLLRRRPNTNLVYAAPSYTSHSRTPSASTSASASTSVSATYPSRCNSIHADKAPNRDDHSHDHGNDTSAISLDSVDSSPRRSSSSSRKTTRSSSSSTSSASASSMQHKNTANGSFRDLLAMYARHDKTPGTTTSTAGGRAGGGRLAAEPPRVFPQRKSSLRSDLSTTRAGGEGRGAWGGSRALRRRPVGNGRVREGEGEGLVAWGEEVDELIAWVRDWGTSKDGRV